MSEQKQGLHIMRKVAAVSRHLRNQCDAAFEELDLTGTQAMVLFYISAAQRQNLHQADIEEAFQISPPSVSRLLRNQEENGFITRQAAPDDARRHYIALTPKAMELNAEIRERFDALNRAIGQMLSQEEMGQLEKLLAKFV